MAGNEYSPNILYNANHYSDEEWSAIQTWFRSRKHWWTPKVHFASIAGEHKPYGPIGRLISWWNGE